MSPLAASADGEPIRYADAVVAAKNGLIDLSDAETADRLYIQNLYNTVLGWLPKRQAGID